MALKHHGRLKDVRAGHGTERAHDFHAVNPSNKFDTEPVEPRSADQLRRVKTMGDGSELRTSRLTEPKRPPSGGAVPMRRRVK